MKAWDRALKLFVVMAGLAIGAPIVRIITLVIDVVEFGFHPPLETVRPRGLLIDGIWTAVAALGCHVVARKLADRERDAHIARWAALLTVVAFGVELVLLASPLVDLR
jgi:hypothetical protein